MSDIVWVGGAAALVAVGAALVFWPKQRKPPGGPGDATRASAPSQPTSRSDGAGAVVAKLKYEEDDDEITMLAPHSSRAGTSTGDDTSAGARPYTTFFDEEAGLDEPTGPVPLILVHAAAQTDKGTTRKKNEDSYFANTEASVYAVADGMGGYAGGEVASRLTVEELTRSFGGAPPPTTRFSDLPRPAAELVAAVERANHSILEEARREPSYRGMGTTLCVARFSPRKQRLYLAHVGDSRAYRLRGDTFVQMTTDHTMGAAGSKGPLADRLMRALGVERTVEVDVLVAKPRGGDRYLLCTDGLSKMVSDDVLRSILASAAGPDEAVRLFVERANQAGGKDNITVIVIQVVPR